MAEKGSVDNIINTLSSDLNSFATQFKKIGNVIIDNDNLILKSSSGEELGRIINGKLVISDAQIIKIPKGYKPDPKLYMAAEEYATHVNKFKNGVSCLKLKSRVTGYTNLGMDDGLFVMPKDEMDALLAKTGGDIRLIEKELGITANDWYKRLFDKVEPTVLLRFDIDNPMKMRVPTGNEATADILLWKPKGKNAGGWSEAVINPLPLTQDLLNNAKQIKIK